ncbi:hypothetical protein CLOBOL_03088 [Enterocloster bolteae ATCC BAA-613]|uniref:Uncharacterized protein n=2 Tax=Enterocloster bolteae TaxID=208479 RepID=A8RRT5_ENTBW|nr:hypothetical protein [Enterocloster bolteae]EDP16325.1 hypothetical protein CLOBOL_03088 [Enterocloster bolteae ATCC BAA-613]
MSSVKGVCPMLPGCPSGQKNGSGASGPRPRFNGSRDNTLRTINEGS